ncbi:GNAT family N-acetyltransferase [Mycobacterium simiae]|uniref:GNAT family N-acetyltransferase n=1 Tax=Mycobacterium simiae TaxID=1784 RepID=UPI00165FBDCC|nr:GNAT family N-acetyltransferase [Mycobacterium simiae]
MDIIIEPFRVGHSGPVLALFVDALNDHYGGDHVAHFNRLMEAYLNNNVDERGYNSTRQVGLVATCARTGRVVGFLNYAVKRQNTIKISPLIVDPTVRKRGVGSRLLAYMHKALSDADVTVRNIYCTIDKHNRAAVSFFTCRGFRVVGSSRDQYLKGHCELILQLPAALADPALDPDVADISLIRAENERQWEQLASKADSFASNEVIRHDILHIQAGAKRAPCDVETKPKVVYLAYHDGDLVGALVLCPKKGGSTKISTAFWKDEATFDALLLALEKVDEFIDTAGRVYVHIPILPGLVQVMQARGWRLDALIPCVDSEQVVIGQWSTNYLESRGLVAYEWPDYHLELHQVIRDREWNTFETPQDLAISLVAEVGELAQELQWKSRGDRFDLDIRSIAAELADIYNYLLRLSWHLDIDLLQSCFDKLVEVREKYPVAVAKNSTRKYTKLA